MWQPFSKTYGSLEVFDLLNDLESNFTYQRDSAQIIRMNENETDLFYNNEQKN